MGQLFEYIDTLNSPYEAFWVDSTGHNDPPRPHWHYYMELLYVDSGTLHAEYEQQKITLGSGDFIIFHPKVIHMISPAGGTAYRYAVLKFDISRLNISHSYTPRLRSLFEHAKNNPNSRNYFSAKEVQSLSLNKVFSTCIAELAKKDFGYDTIVHSLICSLLIELVRLWRESGLDTAEISAGTLNVNAIDSITEYIDEHSSEPLRVEDLAMRCNMSYSYFAKNFKQIYGRSCKEYIEFVRICKAEELLLFTDFDLTFISQETGFSDCSHLIKIFKRWKGITPKQYKLNRSKA